ncbi:MAG: hypothetical protein ACI9JM_002909, partial [Halioglobus sp.]
MKTIRTIGYVGVALALTLPALSIAESQQAASASTENSGNIVSKVSHALAAEQRYTSNPAFSYQWGQRTQSIEPQADWSVSTDASSGYRWAEDGALNSESKRVAEQSGRGWGRNSISEQAGRGWGRNSISEQ